MGQTENNSKLTGRLSTMAEIREAVDAMSKGEIRTTKEEVENLRFRLGKIIEQHNSLGCTIIDDFYYNGEKKDYSGFNPLFKFFEIEDNPNGSLYLTIDKKFKDKSEFRFIRYTFNGKEPGTSKNWIIEKSGIFVEEVVVNSYTELLEKLVGENGEIRNPEELALTGLSVSTRIVTDIIEVALKEDISDEIKDKLLEINNRYIKYHHDFLNGRV